MAAGIPEDVPPVAAHEAQAFQAFVIDGVTKQLQKDNKAERLPEFIRAAGAYGKGDLDADSFLLTLSDLFGEQRSLKLWLINAAHLTIGFAIVGAIQGAWQ